VSAPSRSRCWSRSSPKAIRCLIGLALLSSCSTVTKAIEAIGSLSTPESDIADVRTRSNKAIAAHDLETVMATLVPDVVVTSGNGGVLIGRDSVRASFRRSFADTTFIDFLRTPDSITVSTARPSMAAERGHWMGRSP
jgi:hypothetical protein